MKIFHVDAFTSRSFSGVPAGVCILTYPKVDSWMQNIATEMNLSETAFIIRSADGYSLRWFTPEAEADLCVCGTLASSHILWQENLAPGDETIKFYTRAGVLTSWCEENSMVLDFPVVLKDTIERVVSQVSQQRGAVVRMRLAGERVHLIGQAITVIKSEIVI